MTRRRSDQPLVISPAPGGWARITWHPGQADELVADIHFTVEEPAFTLRADELRIAGPSIHRCRELRLSRIENAVNAAANTRFEIGRHRSEPAPDDLDVYFDTAAKITGKQIEPRFQLRRPAGRRLGDDFYAAVGRAYADAVAAGMNPRKTLALDSDTPADTVARWIREARRRGHLSPGEPGKASGDTYAKAGYGKVGA